MSGNLKRVPMRLIYRLKKLEKAEQIVRDKHPDRVFLAITDKGREVLA